MNDPQTLMGLLLMLGGTAGIVYAILVIRLPARRTHHWPAVPGTVTHSGVRSRDGSTGYGNPNTVYEADVRYTYSVAGREYHSNTLRLGGTLALSLRGRAESIAARYREGQRVDVRYNPANASQSCLQPGEEISSLFIGVGLLVVMVGWFMA